MKKLNFFGLLTIVVAIVFTLSNCNTKVDPPQNPSLAPIITLNTPTVTSYFVALNEVIPLDFICKSNANSNATLTKVTVDVTTPMGTIPLVDTLVPSSYSKQFSLQASYTIPGAASNGQIFTITIAVTDKDGQKATKEITLTVQDMSDIFKFENCVIGAQSSSAYGSFYASDSGMVYMGAKARNWQTRIDFCYYYSTNGITIAATSDPEPATYFNFTAWTTKPPTLLKVISLGTTTTEEDAAFDNIKSSTQLHTVAPGTGYVSSVNQLSDGSGGQLRSYIYFKTVKGKWGIIKIAKYVGTSDQTKSSLQITVKVDK
jgi:hypothetical protein